LTTITTEKALGKRIMWLKEKRFAVRLGGNTYIDCPILVRYKDTPLFSLHRKDDGYLAIDFEVYDATGKVASVKRNNIYPTGGAADRYNLEGDADRVALIDKSTGTVFAEVRKRAAAEPEELAVTLRTYLPNGQRIEFGPDSTKFGSVQVLANVITGAAVGIQIA
jgi:hypothetical protein